MPTYTLRRTEGSNSHQQDYVFLCDGVEVGRCHLRTLSNEEQMWNWTIYIGRHIKGLVGGMPVTGYAPTLDARQTFLKSFERMYAAGLVQFKPGSSPRMTTGIHLKRGIALSTASAELIC